MLTRLCKHQQRPSAVFSRSHRYLIVGFEVAPCTGPLVVLYAWWAGLPIRFLRLLSQLVSLSLLALVVHFVRRPCLVKSDSAYLGECAPAVTLCLACCCHRHHRSPSLPAPTDAPATTPGPTYCSFPRVSASPHPRQVASPTAANPSVTTDRGGKRDEHDVRTGNSCTSGWPSAAHGWLWRGRWQWACAGLHCRIMGALRGQ